MLKQSLNKVWDGLLYGIGFSLPFCVAFYAAMAYQSAGYMKESVNFNDKENYGLSVIESRIEVIEEKLYVMGSLLNANEVAVSGVSIEAEFFDAEGAFVNKCTGSMSGKFKPDEARNFKLKCKPSNTKHEKFAIKVTGAYSWDK